MDGVVGRPACKTVAQKIDLMGLVGLMGLVD